MSVASKLIKVMGAVSHIKKDKKLQGGAGYQYLSEEAITAELHAAFVDANLVIVPIRMELLENRDDTAVNKQTGEVIRITHNTRIAATYRLIDADDGDSIEIQVIGEGSDSGDKTLNKCMTAAYKYALRQAVMISTGDDPDHTASQESTQSQQQATGNADPFGDDLICADCGDQIQGYISKTKKTYTANQVAQFAIKDYGRKLCRNCSYKAKQSAGKAAEEAQQGSLGEG